MRSLSALLSHLCVPFTRHGSGSDEFAGVMTAQSAEEDALVFNQSEVASLDDFLAATRARVFLVGPGWQQRFGPKLEASDKSFHVVSDPRLTVTKILRYLYPDAETRPRSIHPTAHVHPEAKLHPSVGIGPYVQIGNCEVGEGSSIGAFSIVEDGVKIGRNVCIREYCLLGGTGFGFARDERGRLLQIPHIGRLEIEDDVDIFPYVNVDRGTLDETRVCRGAKIDHYCHIGHNTRVEEDALITAGTILCGGSQVGPRAYMGAGSLLRESIRVDEGATVGLGGVVVRHVDAGETVAGVPAKVLTRR